LPARDRYGFGKRLHGTSHPRTNAAGFQEGIAVARSTIEWLMKRLGLRRADATGIEQAAQQNASLVEQVAAEVEQVAAEVEAMRDQASGVSQTISVFRVGRAMIRKSSERVTDFAVADKRRGSLTSFTCFSALPASRGVRKRPEPASFHCAA
jgi:hypothetical protein